MKRLVLILILLFGFITFVFAEDRVRVQVQFRKGIFACSNGDEIVDWNMGGGNTYEHTCKDGTWLNSFKEYNGVLSYTPEEYAIIKQEDIDTKKQKLVNKWLYEIRNPPPYIEPTKKELEQEKANLMEQVNSLQARIDAK